MQYSSLFSLAESADYLATTVPHLLNLVAEQQIDPVCYSSMTFSQDSLDQLLSNAPLPDSVFLTALPEDSSIDHYVSLVLPFRPVFSPSLLLELLS